MRALGGPDEESCVGQYDCVQSVSPAMDYRVKDYAYHVTAASRSDG